MGWMDRLFGQNPATSKSPAVSAAGSADEQALARYRYLLRTAPPEAIEQAHAEAFAQLSPEQRAQALRELSQSVPVSDRGMAADDQPQTLARLATRAEMRQPGTLERTFGRSSGGLGSMMAGSLLGSIAGTFIGTAIAHQFLGGFDHDASDFTDAEPGDLDAASADASGLEDDGGGYDDIGGDFGGSDGMFDV